MDKIITYVANANEGKVYIDGAGYRMMDSYAYNDNNEPCFVWFNLFTKRREHKSIDRYNDSPVYLPAFMSMEDAKAFIQSAAILLADVVSFPFVKVDNSKSADDVMSVFQTSLQDVCSMAHNRKDESDDATITAKAFELFRIIGAFLDANKSQLTNSTINSNVHRKVIDTNDVAETLNCISKTIEFYTCYAPDAIEYYPTSHYVSFMCLYLNMYLTMKSIMAAGEPQTIEFILLNVLAAMVIDFATDRHYNELYLRPKEEHRPANSIMLRTVDSILSKLPPIKANNMLEAMTIMQMATNNDKIRTLLSECPIQLHPWIFMLGLPDEHKTALLFDLSLKPLIKKDFINIHNGADFVKMVVKPLVDSCVIGNGYYSPEKCVELIISAINIEKFATANTGTFN